MDIGRLLEEVLDYASCRQDLILSFDDRSVSDVEVALPRLIEARRIAGGESGARVTCAARPTAMHDCGVLQRLRRLDDQRVCIRPVDGEESHWRHTPPSALPKRAPRRG
jgi:hypothetical protein